MVRGPLNTFVIIRSRAKPRANVNPAQLATLWIYDTMLINIAYHYVKKKMVLTVYGKNLMFSGKIYGEGGEGGVRAVGP